MENKTTSWHSLHENPKEFPMAASSLESLWQASLSHDTKYLQSQLERLTPHPYPLLQSTFFKIIKEVKEITSSRMTTQFEFDVAVFQAAACSYSEILRHLLQTHLPSDERYSSILYSAVTRNQREIVQILLDHKPIEDEWLRGALVSQAACHQNIPMIQDLLQQGSIPEESREDAVMTAAYLNNPALAKALLPISETTRKACIAHANLYGHKDVLQVL